MNPTYKPAEGKREEFRKYLEKNGVMDALTKVLVNLYEEPDKPDNALEFIRNKLAQQADLETHAQMRAKLDELQAKIDQCELEIATLKAGHEQQDNAPLDTAAEGGSLMTGGEEQGGMEVQSEGGEKPAAAVEGGAEQNEDTDPQATAAEPETNE